MNSLTKTFENSDIRIAEIDGKIWWNLKDVCASLGMGGDNHKQIRNALPPDQVQLVTFTNQLDGKNYKYLSVNRPGLLKFIWRSNKPNALVFSDWCAQVIDEILQTGRYDMREHEEQIQQLEQALARTEHQLAEERAEVDRRVFLVIKEAVKEWRDQNGQRFTDCSWRLKHYTQCCKRLKGLIYKKGNTPYITPGFIRNAHDAMKFYYQICQRNPAEEQTKYTQMKISDNFV